MKPSHFYWVLTFGSLLLVFLILASQAGPPAPQPQNITQVCFGGNCFQVELALTPQEQETGLMNRTYLAPDKGMLFIFPQDGIYPFWMKDTLIPLDMIWMSSNRTVVFIGRDEQPCGPVVCPSISPGVPARYVLEVNGETADRIGLKVGDTLQFT